MRIRERERDLIENSDSRAREADKIMTRDERMEVEGKGRRTARDVKIAGELLKDNYRR